MKHSKLFCTLAVAVFLNTSLFSQHVHCDETVHGIFEHIHMDCTEEILITSFEEDTNGTIITGVITTTGGIVIKPGNSFVRIVPEHEEEEHHHRVLEGSMGITTHTTKIGNNGNIGKSIDKNKARGVNEITVYPNPIVDFINIRSISSEIISYQISNFYGKIIKKEKLSSLNTRISVLNIKKGMYLLKIQLENGTQQTKTIIKN